MSKVLAFLIAVLVAQGSTSTDRRLIDVRTTDTPVTLRTYSSREEWVARAHQLRHQILVSAGLWPAPPKPDLDAHIFGLIDHGTYTIEKAYFQSLPGHYVTGNLYRPKNANGKVPAVLCPHGHWTYGRLENTPTYSGPLRPANLAQQGYVAFAFDMVGYNDSTAVNHRFGGPREALWGFSALGLQLWNAIRSIDFLTSLPNVDANRIACTGESGGGTQTFLLAAVDDRVRFAAPVCMISAHFQGGDVCENAPNLRIDTSNVEFGAMIAPRPLLLVAASGDWTKNTLQVEYPAIQSIYRMLGVEDHVKAVLYEAPHNYNQRSRESVYGWLGHWLLGRTNGEPLAEKVRSAPSLTEELVFYGRGRPANELNESGMFESWTAMARQQLASDQPKSESDLEHFRERFGTALRFSLMASMPSARDITAHESTSGAAKKWMLSRTSAGDQVELFEWPDNRTSRRIVLIAGAGDTEKIETLKDALVKAGQRVFLVKCFEDRRRTLTDDERKFFTTYNRTSDANRIQDILTGVAYLRGQYPDASIAIIARGKSGLDALLARALLPSIDRMLVDARQFDNTTDASFLESLPIPGLRRAGDFSTAVTVAPLTPLLIENTGGKFRTDSIEHIYRILGKPGAVKISRDPLSHSQILEWLRQD